MELVRRVDFRKPVHRFGVARAGLGALFFLMLACAAVGAEPGSTMPLRIGVYQVAPYGGAGEGRLVLLDTAERLGGAGAKRSSRCHRWPAFPRRPLTQGVGEGGRGGAGGAY